ncbi:MAG: DUF4290 domain-containing protein [Cyclobacteriaceae bacterium]
MTIDEYNTQRPDIILKEYGRNVQKMVEYLRQVPDKQKRTKMAAALIELIKQLNPSIKEQPEDPQRMWDDVYIMADFNLDLDIPYPVPPRDVLQKKPNRIPYPQSNVRFRHYGKNIEKLVQEAMKKEDPKEREELVIYLVKLMKTYFSSCNKEILDDSVILKDIYAMSGGTLSINLDKVREDNLFEKLYRDRDIKGKPFGQQHSHHKNRGHRHGGRPFMKNKHHRRRDQ